MSNLRLDPDLAKAVAPFANIPQPTPQDPLQIRAAANTGFQLFFGPIKAPDGVVEAVIQVTSKDGTSIPVYRFTPSTAAQTNPSSPQPAAIYLHGGGLVAGSVPVCRGSIGKLAEASGVTIYGVGYRLAPEYPYPKPLEDVYATLEWLQSRAEAENIDPARIAIIGVSAGGGLAAATALLARDKGLSPPLAKQILIYPMLDDRTRLDASNPLAPLLMAWTSKHNEIGWGAYLGEEKGEVSQYAAAARAKDVAGLPRTYVEVGNLDLFRDEDVDYAARLSKAHIDVELHVYPGLVHGWDIFSQHIPASKKAFANRVAALKDI